MGGCSSESRIETLAAPLCLSRAPPSAGVEFAPDGLPLVPSLCRPEWSLGSQNEPEGMSRLVAYGREEEALSPEVGEMPRTLAGIARFQAEDVEAIGLYRSSDRTRDAVEARLLLTGYAVETPRLCDNRLLDIALAMDVILVRPVVAAVVGSKTCRSRSPL
jgi:hypothetical protein